MIDTSSHLQAAHVTIGLNQLLLSPNGHVGLHQKLLRTADLVIIDYLQQLPIMAQKRYLNAIGLIIQVRKPKPSGYKKQTEEVLTST